MKKKLTPSSVVIVLQAYAHVSYYVNIGAFKNSANGSRLVKKSKSPRYQSSQAFKEDKQLHYVYALSTNDKRSAYAVGVKWRAETECKDAWVFEGNLGSKSVVKIEPIVAAPAESAKEVLLKRAEAVRNYLVSQGIGTKRITVKGEGEKIPFYAEGATLGRYTDRVEIEFKKGK